MKRIFFILTLLCLSTVINAQTAASYAFISLPSPFASIAATGTVVPTLSADNVTAAGIPIGFSFLYCGLPYTTLSASSNGWVSLTESPAIAASNVAASIDGPGWLMPFWDDLDGTSGTAYYQVSGIAPMRIFTFEWNNWGSVSGSGAATFQIKFYETFNLIDFHYGPTTFGGTSSTIGISNNNVSDWQTLSDGSAAPGVLAAPLFETGIPIAPDGGRLYRWTPSSCPVAPITGPTSICVGGITAVFDVTAGCTWSSSDPAVAFIAAGTGTIVGISAGTTNISYISPLGCYATMVFTVTPTPSIVGDFTICTGVPATYTHPTPGGTWTSSNISVATVVVGTGVVSGVATGTAKITYTMGGGCKSSVTITVNVSPSPITGTFVICQGTSTTLSTTSTGGTWSSSFGSIADVDASGVMTGLMGGVSDISYTFATGCASIAPVTINPLPAPLTGGTSLCIFGTLPLSSTTAGGTWLSTDPTIATVDGTGLVTAGGTAGTSVISYTLPSGCYVVTTVSVVVVVSPITGPTTVCKYENQTYTNATSIGVWSSSDLAVGTINSSGVFSPLSAGTTTISYTLASGCFSMLTVTVNPNEYIVGTATVCQGLTRTMTNAVPGGTWSTGDASVFTVNASTGVVTGVAGGIANISYTNTYGCITHTAVTVFPTPSAIAGDLLICVADNSALTSTPTGGTWSSSEVSVATIDAATGIAAGIAGGTSAITYTSIPGCIITAVITVSPTPAPIAGGMIVCPTYTLSLTNPATGGTWSSSDATIASVGASSGVLTGVNIAGGTATITYAPPGSGCITTRVATVSPAPVITPSTPVQICVGASAAFSSSMPGSTWTSSNVGVATVVTSTGVVTGVAGGTSTITCYAGNGCTSTVTVTVNVNPGAITGTTVVCVNATTTLTSSPGGGTWSSSDGGIATVATGSSVTGIVTGVVANTATISYTLSTGCYRTITVTVNAIPGVITGTAAVCEGLTTNLTGSGGGTWTSGSTGIATIGLGTGVVTGVAFGTSNISYILPTGCFRTRILTVNALPAAIGGSAAVCPGTNITLTNSTPGGAWSSLFPAIATVVSGSGLVTGVATGATPIIYTLPTGCTAVTTVTVMTAPAAVITPIGDTVLCPGDFVTFTASALAGASYVWYDGGMVIAGATTPTHVVSTTGIFQVRVTVGAGCSTISTPMSASVMPAVATITVPGTTTTTCAGTPVTLNANTGAGLSYQWELAGAAIPGAFAATYNALTGGNYTVRVTNSAGCWAVSTPVAITVLPTPANIVTASGPLTICNGGNVLLTAAAGTGYTYQWHNGAGPIPGATSISFTATIAGSYHAVVTNLTGCATTTAASVVGVNPLPDVTIAAGGPRIVCAGGVVSLTAAPGFSYQWYRDGAAIPGAAGAGYIASMGGGYRVRVTNTATGCTDMTHADSTVSVISSPVVVSLTPAKFCWGGSSLLSTDVSGLGSAIGYQWSRNGVVIPGATSGTYNAAAAGAYSCTITVPLGCTVATGPVNVIELPLPDPPITFTGVSLKTGNYYLTYQWYKNLLAIPGATTSSTPSTGNGNYKVGVTDTNGCQSISAEYVLNGVPVTGVWDVNNTEIKIFPNPAQNVVHIESMQQVRTVIGSMDGRTLIDIRGEQDVDISSLADGVYLVTVFDTDNNVLKTQQLVKRSE